MAQQIWLVIIMTKFVGYYIMDGRAFVVAKEAFIMETVVFWYCDNGKMMKNNSFSVNAINVNNHLYSAINLNHVKLRYIQPCNFLTKRALVSQQSTLAVAKILTFRIIWINHAGSNIWYHTHNLTINHRHGTIKTPVLFTQSTALQQSPCNILMIFTIADSNNWLFSYLCTVYLSFHKGN